MEIENFREPVPNIIFYLATIIFILITNLMLIYGFYKTSRPFTIVTKLFIYLSIVDIALTVIYVLFNVLTFFLGENIKINFAIAWAVYYTIEFVRLLVFWTISFLRFLSIFKPMFRAKTRTIYIILLLEDVVGLLAASILLSFLLSLEFNQFISISTLLDLGLQIAFTVITLSLNVSSLIILRRSTKPKVQQKGDSMLSNQMAIKRKKMALNTLLMITTAQFICVIPISSLLFSSVNIKPHNFSLFVSFQCVNLLNNGINSIIVILRTKNLRAFYRTKCNCFYRRKINSNLEMGNNMELKNI